MLKKFCTPIELGRLEREFLEHKMVGADHAGYTTRFHELSRLVPHLATPEPKCIERYLRGLVPQVSATMAAVQPATLEEAILRSEAMTEELVQGGTLTAAGNKRKDVGGSSSGKKPWQPQGKKQFKGKAMVAADTGKREYTGAHPLCTKCNLHHPANVPCMICFNCQKIGHKSRHCREPRVQVAPQNVAPLNQPRPQGARGACFECGATDHYRSNCPQWVGQQVQVAVHPNQL